jgi:tetratricopeptide (TPR) repeat protein
VSEPSVTDVVDRVKVLNELGRYAQAVELLQPAVARHPGDPALLTMLCGTQAKLGNVHAALAAGEAAVAAAPESTDAIRALSRANHSAGNVERGRDLSAQLMQLDPSDPLNLYVHFFALYGLYQGTRNSRRRVQLLQEAAQTSGMLQRVEPGSAATFTVAALNARMRGDGAEAASIVKNALVIYPGDADLIALLAQLEYSVGDSHSDEAVAHARRALSVDPNQPLASQIVAAAAAPVRVVSLYALTVGIINVVVGPLTMLGWGWVSKGIFIVLFAVVCLGMVKAVRLGMFNRAQRRYYRRVHPRAWAGWLAIVIGFALIDILILILPPDDPSPATLGVGIVATVAGVVSTRYGVMDEPGENSARTVSSNDSIEPAIGATAQIMSVYALVFGLINVLVGPLTMLGLGWVSKMVLIVLLVLPCLGMAEELFNGKLNRAQQSQYRRLHPKAWARWVAVMTGLFLIDVVIVAVPPDDLNPTALIVGTLATVAGIIVTGYSIRDRPGENRILNSSTNRSGEAT